MREWALAAHLLLFGAVSACLALAAEARASVSIAVSWDALLRESVAAAFVTPVEGRSVWEAGRIVTYTRVHVDKQVAGALSASEDPWIRTLGGVVGTIGQRVEGEAVLAPGYQALVFMGAGQAGTYHVTARAQGQFPVVTTGASGPRVIRANAAGLLLKPTSAPESGGARLAGDVLHDRAVEDAARDIAADWKRAHAN